MPLFWPEITKTRFNLSGELINVTLIIIQFGESYRCVRTVANISFVTCGRTDGRTDGSHWMISVEFGIGDFYETLIEKIQIRLKLGKSIGHFR